MKSLKTRLEDVREEVLHTTEMYGIWRAMEKYGVNDYTCFRRWLETETGQPDFGSRPKMQHNGAPLGDQLVEAFLNKVYQLETENQKLRDEIEMLNMEVERNRERNVTVIERQVERVLRICN